MRRGVHAALDFVESLTPLGLRERYRDLYLRWYHRFFPYGYREFQSADLALPSADTLAIDSADPGPSDMGARPKTTQAGDGLPFACHPTYRPKVSVVLPVWNQAEFLAGSVRSVLAQSYENLELIVVDDGSDEDLSSALTPWLDDSRVRVIKRRHEGIAAALNAGFREASGDFLAWTSADNLMKPEMLSALLGYLLRRPSVRMAYSNIELIDDRGRPLTGSDVRVMHQRPHVTHQLDLPRSTEALGLEDDNFVGSCFLYRRSAAMAAGEYDGSLLGAEDYDYWLRLTEIGEVRRIDGDECLYAYRVHDGSLTGRHDHGAIRDNMRIARERHLERLRRVRQPFRVFVFYEDGCEADYEWVEALAGSLEQQGQRVTLICIGAVGRADSEFLSVTHVQDTEQAAALIQKDSAQHGEKTLLLSFLNQPSRTAALRPSSNSNTIFSCTWLAPMSGSDRELPEESWLLCGSTNVLEALPADRRRAASLLIPFRGAFRPGEALALKARGSRYTVPELASSTRPAAVYAGPLRADFLDVDLLVSTAERHPELDFILVGSDSEALDGDARLQRQDNLIVLAGRPADTWHIYLSRAAFLWAPLRDEPTLVGAMQEVLLIYLAAGKPVLATDAVRAAGLEDLPNAVITHRHQCPEGVARVLNIASDWTIADEYRRRLGPDVVACTLLRTANAQIYGNTMAPLRKGNSG